MRQRPPGVRMTADEPRSGTNLAQELDGAGEGAHRVFGVLRFFKAHGSVRAELEGGAGLADRGRLEVGALQHDARSPFADGAIRAADHARKRDGADSAISERTTRIVIGGAD